MSSRVPSFLLGGINKTYNFLGTRTAQTTAFGVLETGIRLSPVVLVIAAGSFAAQESETEVAIPAAQVPQRRTSLTQ